MAADFQGSLLEFVDVDDAADIEPQPFGDGPERTLLGHGAWIDVFRGWMRGADPLFEHLADAVPWQAERRQMYERVVDVPRLLCFYDDGDELPHPALVAAKAALNRHYRPELGEPFCTAGLCYYRDGRDSVGRPGKALPDGQRGRLPRADAWHVQAAL